MRKSVKKVGKIVFEKGIKTSKKEGFPFLRAFKSIAMFFISKQHV